MTNCEFFPFIMGEETGLKIYKPRAGLWVGREMKSDAKR